MTSTKYFFSCVLLFLSISAYSQTKDTTVFMKWKLKPNEVLSYKTVMKEIDTTNQKDFSMDGMMKAMGADKLMDDKDKKVQSAEMQKIFKQLNAQVQHSDYVTRLQEKKKNIIDIEMMANNTTDQKSVNDTDKSLKAVQAFMNRMSSGVMLRGSIHEDGTIESFYTKNDQKNLLAMMFELPGKPVKPGDTWPLSIHLISMDQNFKCDSCYKKNIVTLINIENKGGEHIATLKYDILEFVVGDFMSPFNNSNTKMSMKMSYEGIATFSIEKGRWVFYEGRMSLSNNGMMSSQSTKKISLIAN